MRDNGARSSRDRLEPGGRTKTARDLGTAPTTAWSPQSGRRRSECGSPRHQPEQKAQPVVTLQVLDLFTTIVAAGRRDPHVCYVKRPMSGRMLRERRKSDRPLGKPGAQDAALHHFYLIQNQSVF